MFTEAGNCYLRQVGPVKEFNEYSDWKKKIIKSLKLCVTPQQTHAVRNLM